MAKNTFRSKKYTARVKPVSPAQIERMRNSALKKARPDDYKRIKFLKSAQFDKRIRQNIRENRVTRNIQNIKKIANAIGDTKERQKTVVKLFGEIHTVNKHGKKVKRNTFTSMKQTERLAKVSKQISLGKFNIKRYVSNTRKYKDVKRHLPTNAPMGDILSALDRTNFYFENRKTILQHNKNVSKHGKLTASDMSAGKKLSQAYMGQLNNEDLEFLEDIEFL